MLDELFADAFPAFITADLDANKYIGRVRAWFADLNITGAQAPWSRPIEHARWDHLDVNAQTWVAIAAAVIAVIALYFNAQYTRAADRAARSAEAQTKIQQQLRIDAAQPYVWVDVRPDDVTGTLLNLVIGNSGPTVATNVRVQIEPSLPAIDQLRERAQAAQTRLADGIRSLAPGRTIAWPLGQGFNLLHTDDPQVHTFTVTADGPFGAVPSQTYIIDLADLRGSLDRPAALHKLAKVVEELSRTLRSAANERTDAAPALPSPYRRRPPRIGQPWMSHRRRTPRRLSRRGSTLEGQNPAMKAATEHSGADECPSAVNP